MPTVPAYSDPILAQNLRCCYEKHAAELRAIEDSETKFIITVLGILGAGASFLGGLAEKGATGFLNVNARAGLGLVIGSIIAVGWIISRFRKNARRGTRLLLVQCEEALGFFEANLYLPKTTLYPAEFKEFPEIGDWLSSAYLVAVLAGIGFVILLAFM